MKVKPQLFWFLFG